MIDAFLKLPLGKRYAYGMYTVLISGIILAVGSYLVSPDSMMLWMLMTITAFTHWIVTGIYCWWERRWYRFPLFAFSTVCTWFYIELGLKVWKTT